MGRRIIYRIDDKNGNRFSETEWLELERLQHWYNSEFSWSTGRLAFKRFIVFPNTVEFSGMELPAPEIISRRREALRKKGMPEAEIIAQMEEDGLLTVKWGGYSDNCLASGFTRVANNEWNAYLVCDFLLKASTIFEHCAIRVTDEGKFIKSGEVTITKASVTIGAHSRAETPDIDRMCLARSVFSVVDSEKYLRHRSFRNMIPEFNKLNKAEQKHLVQQWNWLGYEGNFDDDGDDRKGFDLNKKVRSFHVSSGG